MLLFTVLFSIPFVPRPFHPFKLPYLTLMASTIFSGMLSFRVEVCYHLSSMLRRTSTVSKSLEICLFAALPSSASSLFLIDSTASCQGAHSILFTTSPRLAYIRIRELFLFLSVVTTRFLCFVQLAAPGSRK